MDNDRYLNSREIQSRLIHAVNYNNWLFSHVEKYAGSRILEVGCALGNFTKKIINRDFVCAIDIEEEYVEAIKSFFKDRDSFKAVKCDISLPEALTLKGSRFDTIICFNVLEHIKNDDIALKNMYQLLESRGSLCLIVPAFQSIFGEMDKTDNHCLRYSKKLLLKKAETAGFQVLSAKYINALGFLSWWFNGKVLKRKYIPFRQMLIYDKIIPLVTAIERLVSLPFGQSLVLILRKRDKLKNYV